MSWVDDEGYHYEQESGIHIFECDQVGCVQIWEGGGTFQEVWASAKKRGWRCRLTDGERVHYCPEHARERFML